MTRISKKDKFAIYITDKVGSMTFFAIIVIWTILWLAWNALVPQSLQFDPYPAFVLWLFISNMIQIFLMPLILIGQNVQSKTSYNLEKKMDSELKEIKKLIEEIKNQKQNGK